MKLLIFENTSYLEDSFLITEEQARNWKKAKELLSNRSNFSNIDILFFFLNKGSIDFGCDAFSSLLVRTEREEEAFRHGCYIGSEGNCDIHSFCLSQEETDFLLTVAELLQEN